MKQFFFLTALLWFASLTFSQPAASQSSFAGIYYQTVVRDSEGLPLQNVPVTLLMTIRTNTSDGEAAYSETHSATTNLFGLVNLVIGQGTPVSGTFDAINWSAAPHYLETAIDATGSGEFQVLGVTQFLSVPYALSSSNGVPGGNNPGDMLYWNGDTWIQVPAGQNGQVLTFSNGVPVWGGVQLPILNTSAVTNITAFTAYSGGTIASDGGSPVTTRGICWNNSPAPTIANFKITAGSGSGNFLAQMTGLESSTQYFVRAFATNSAGTSYGQEMTFYTTAGSITLSTTAVTNITTSTATSGGNITLNGGSPVTARGVCWNTAAYPTTAHNKTTDGTGNGTFVSQLTGLTNNTQYYVRAYATNSLGTSYGNQVTFTTLPNLPPVSPFSPIPEDGSQNQSVSLVLSWSCSDPENDPLTYDVFFGTENPPAQVETAIADTFYSPGTLNFNTAYFWKIVAHDDHGNITEGEVWGFTTAAESLVGWWPFDGTFNDESGNGHHGELIQGPSGNCTFVSDRNGVPNSALQFSGNPAWNAVGSYVKVPNDPVFYFDNSYTINFFIKIFSNCHVGEIINKGWDGNGFHSRFHNYDLFWLAFGSSTGGVTSPTTDFTENWHMVTFTRNGNTSEGALFIDGNLMSSGSVGIPPVTNYDLWFGIHDFYHGNGSCYPLQGILDEIKIWNRELSPEEINGIFNSGITAIPILSNPIPNNGSLNISINPTLSWSCTDPDGDPLTYDVYFGTENQPAQVATAIADTFYLPGTLNYDTTYYWKIVAHDDHGNSTEGEVWSFTTKELAIGDIYGGGKVAYIFQSFDPGYVEGEEHGIIASQYDQALSCWYNGAFITTGAIGTEIGTGKTNTNTIILAQGVGTYAAIICDGLIIEGYDDWFLPSKDELNLLYQNRFVVGNFLNDVYWNSSEINSNGARVQNFSDGNQYSLSKNKTVYVRAIRYF